MATSPPPPFRVLLDFDGTLVGPNVAILLVQEFCPNGVELAQTVDQELHNGKITLREAWARQAALLPADRVPEMSAWAVEHTPLRPGALELVELLKRHHVPTTVVSGGLDFYIHPVLQNAGLKLPVLCDSMERTLDGRLQVSHPFGHATCRLCGICKAQVTRTLAHEGTRTVFVGDGSTDRYAAEVADIVFARRRLKTYWEAAGVPFYPFEDFAPVTQRMRRWREGDDPIPERHPVGVRSSACPISHSLAIGFASA
jgi:2-hydroxy-3-keto-5-methylthiopentenyl-1-phosphate phosphatase